MLDLLDTIMDNINTCIGATLKVLVLTEVLWAMFCRICTCKRTLPEVLVIYQRFVTGGNKLQVLLNTCWAWGFPAKLGDGDWRILKAVSFSIRRDWDTLGWRFIVIICVLILYEKSGPWPHTVIKMTIGLVGWWITSRVSFKMLNDCQKSTFVS